MGVKVYVGAVALLATVAGVAASATVPQSQPAHPFWLLVLLGLIAIAEYAQIRYHHHNEIDAFNLIEGMLAPLVFTASGRNVVIVAAAGILGANILRGNEPLKALFNASQWVLAAAVGAIVLHAIRPAFAPGSGAVFALAITLLVMSAVNQAAIAGVMTIATGSPLGSRASQSVSAVATGHLVSIVASLIVGVCLTGGYLWNAWTLFAGGVFVLAMNAAGRANASLHTDSARLVGLQRATHALATSLDVHQAVPVFLSEVKRGFEVRAAELVLFSSRDCVVHSLGADEAAYSVVGHHELADVLADTLTGPAHLSVGAGSADVSAALERTGHQRVLAAPLRAGNSTIGMLLLFDRVGMEGFDSGELSIAAALSRELVGFLERVDLLKTVDEERRKLNDILESTSDGILSIDAEGVVTSWNNGLAVITGYDADEMVGTRHFGLLRPRDPGGRDLIIERWRDLIDSAVGLPNDMQIVNADGESVWLSCSYSRIPADERRGDVLVIVARNVTQAHELERLKDDFVAVVSHELRTPLVPIKGWAQTLINRGDRLTEDQRRTAVQSILAQAQKLESLVLNILEASRVEAGQVDGEGVADVAAITTRLVEDTVAARPDRAVRVHPPSSPCHVRGSSVWVERAVSNLVANALKYSPDHEPVDVEISTEGDDVVVTVTDRGPGIAADAQERIFERFERLEETQKQTGTGLGLYITRRLARALGGEVSVSSVPGVGSTFRLRLPLARVTPMPGQRSVDNHDDTVVNLR